MTNLFFDDTGEIGVHLSCATKDSFGNLNLSLSRCGIQLSPQKCNRELPVNIAKLPDLLPGGRTLTTMACEWKLRGAHRWKKSQFFSAVLLMRWRSGPRILGCGGARRFIDAGEGKPRFVVSMVRVRARR